MKPDFSPLATELAALVEKLLNFEPEKRPSFNELLDEPFIQSLLHKHKLQKYLPQYYSTPSVLCSSSAILQPRSTILFSDSELSNTRLVCVHYDCYRQLFNSFCRVIVQRFQ